MPGMQSGNNVILLVLMDLIGVLITEDTLTHLYILMLRSLSVVMLQHVFFARISWNTVFLVGHRGHNKTI